MPLLDDYITDVLMRDLVGHDRQPVSFLIYLWFAAQQTRVAGPVQVSYQQLAEFVGVSKSSAQAAVSLLTKRKLLEMSKDTVTATPRYTVLQPWKRNGAHNQRQGSRGKSATRT